mmetsp:Transcript_120258/g.336724  ORF Transcript_120258/g.336724 Transcript_120258/m.336724 type:complete len:256 (+) Transcript_120258:369-1136(+)
MTRISSALSECDLVKPAHSEEERRSSRHWGLLRRGVHGLRRSGALPGLRLGEVELPGHERIRPVGLLLDDALHEQLRELHQVVLVEVLARCVRLAVPRRRGVRCGGDALLGRPWPALVHGSVLVDFVVAGCLIRCRHCNCDAHFFVQLLGLGPYSGRAARPGAISGSVRCLQGDGVLAIRTVLFAWAEDEPGARHRLENVDLEGHGLVDGGGEAERPVRGDWRLTPCGARTDRQDAALGNAFAVHNMQLHRGPAG